MDACRVREVEAEVKGEVERAPRRVAVGVAVGVAVAVAVAVECEGHAYLALLLDERGDWSHELGLRLVPVLLQDSLHSEGG